jgi:hypothetical protein
LHHPDKMRGSFALMGGGPMSTLVDFRTPLVWFVIAFGVLSIAGLIWMTLSSIRWRYTGHATRCPLDGQDAHVIVARGAAGQAIDVVRCSKMSPPSRVACSKTCLDRRRLIALSGRAIVSPQ